MALHLARMKLVAAEFVSALPEMHTTEKQISRKGRREAVVLDAIFFFLLFGRRREIKKYIER